MPFYISCLQNFKLSKIFSKYNFYINLTQYLLFSFDSPLSIYLLLYIYASLQSFDYLELMMLPKLANMYVALQNTLSQDFSTSAQLTLGQIIWWGEGSTVLCIVKMLSNITSHYWQDASNTHKHTHPVWQLTVFPDISKCPLGCIITLKEVWNKMT